MRLLPFCCFLLLVGCAATPAEPGPTTSAPAGSVSAAGAGEATASDSASANVESADAGSPDAASADAASADTASPDLPIFTGTDDDADYPPAAPQDCIAPRRVRSVEHVGNHSVLFYLAGNKVWRSRLRTRCIALRRGVVLSYEPRAGRLCAGDTVKVLDNFGSQLSQVGTCVLGEFDYLSEEQAAAFLEYQ